MNDKTTLIVVGALVVAAFFLFSGSNREETAPAGGALPPTGPESDGARTARDVTDGLAHVGEKAAEVYARWRDALRNNGSGAGAGAGART